MVNLLSVKDLKYKEILDGLSFSIKEDTFNILIGKNGVGKTTLVKAILGLIDYTGDIRFKYKRKDIGVITDFTEITKDTVSDYLLEPLLNLGYTETRAKRVVYTTAKHLGIGTLIERKTNTLTEEEELIVLLVHSIIHKPKLVIIDNTLDILSSHNKKAFINYLKNIKITVIFITNDSRYFKYGNRLLIMTKDNIEEIKQSKSISSLEKKLIRNNSELPFCLELSNKLYLYGIIDKLYNTNSELVENIWK